MSGLITLGLGIGGNPITLGLGATIADLPDPEPVEIIRDNRMQTLTHATESIGIGFPRSWDPAELSAVSVTLEDLATGDTLLTASAQLYPAAALAFDARRYSTDIILTEGASALHAGDLIRISGGGGSEDHTVKGWNSSTRTVTLEGIADIEFEAGSTVHRLSAVAAVDLSDTEVFPAGTQLLVTWTPSGAGSKFTQICEVEESSQVDIAGFTSDFKALYSRAYGALTKPENRLDTIIRLARGELRLDLESRFLDIARIKDQTLIAPPLMAKVAEMWARDGDEQTSDELVKYQRAYSAALKSLCKNPIWVDLNGDGKQDAGEVDTYPEQYEMVW